MNSLAPKPETEGNAAPIFLVPTQPLLLCATVVMRKMVHSDRVMFASPMSTQVCACVQLRECAAVLLMKLLDDKVPALLEGTQLLKALNVLMLKILDNCNR